MKKIWGIFWALMALLGVYALQTTMQLPSESRNAFLFGMSPLKLVMCAGIAGISLCCLAGSILSFKGRPELFSTGKAAGIAVYILTFILILGCIFLTPPVGKTAFERSLLERLTPAAYWAAAFVFLSVPLLFIQKQEQVRISMKGSDNAFLWGLILMLLMTGALFFALQTGIGLDPISGTFYRQGVSLLEGFIVVPLLILYPLLPLTEYIRNKRNGIKLPAVIPVLFAVLVWAAAVWFWQTTPFEGRSYFAPALRAPNYNFYPASDAENYDLLAQSILTGNGFRNGLTVVRPIYAAFLALLHLIFGNNYMALTNGQILLLALIPVFVFLIGKALRHPESGLLAAVWVIWREIYSIRMTPFVQVSNSRLLMSDLPAMLLTAAVIFSAVCWTSGKKSSLQALICGGLIGLSMLLRTQCFVLIPAVWAVILFSGKSTAVKWRSVLISLLGLILVFGPWTVWGKVRPNTTANADVSEGQYLLNLYRKAAGDDDPSLGLSQLILRHPAETGRAFIAHFLNNEISSLLVLPVRLLKPAEASQYFYDDDLFWYRENARETIEKNTAILLIYLAMTALGAGTAYRRNGFAGLAPFLFHLVYNLGNALAMTSGFRFILPVDWILFFYFAFGCIAAMRFFCRLALFGREPDSEAYDLHARNEQKVPGGIYACSAVCLLLIGLILPFCDGFIPSRYPPEDSRAAAERWEALSPNAKEILSAFSRDDLVFLEGRAFYPRFYKAGEGDSGGSSSAKRGLGTDRMVWMFHGERVHVLSLPIMPEQVPDVISVPVQDPMEIVAAGIPMEDYIQIIEMIPLDPGEQR